MTEDITKVVITNPGPVTHDNTHYLRYRVISEDKTEKSDWSPVYEIAAPTVTIVSAKISMQSNVITLVWGDENNRPEYDVFVKFGNNNISYTESAYTYHGTSKIHTYGFINKFFTPPAAPNANVTPDRVYVRIQVSSFDKTTFGTSYATNPILIFQNDSSPFAI